MREETASKVCTIATYAARFDCAAQETQYLLAEKLPLPDSLREAFAAATSPYDLIAARERYDVLRKLTYCLQIRDREPVVAQLILAHTDPGGTRYQGKDIGDLFRAFADELMALPGNKQQPDLRKNLEPTAAELADMAKDFEAMGCTMNGTVIAKLPPMTP
jgi:hypothetical protein